ncbi:16S rRNA (cytidine(1402)-2'-O)-methyltransferase [Varibaculum cambriense]|uniref:16S rRNA (cytidine(1402)-2'-O)-methyltransferase n=1 Tax=uncultured Varibaculum sp. TaxID=413896 RepID=UPI002151E20B|nr:16S rRNA (cytidine(1402)-2'-O)-methyltransferase [uncultured Varibaculum sp.]WIK88813.1 16S rRNA (cytidine(1402)-2'-O)-methyltransferase [Varibaculum cambriense]
MRVEQFSWDAGVIALAATPIGNLADATPRLVSAFEQADLIAAEDTRRTGLLREHLRVSRRAPLVSCHEHNEAAKAEQIVSSAVDGQRVLLVTDAGMPTVSDPGYVIVQAAIKRGVPLTVLPGPSAPLIALALSGLPTDRFCFEGFLPRKSAAQTRRLEELSGEERTMIFLESPRRLAATLGALAQVFGAGRPAAVCRELTKIHEEVWRGTLGELKEKAKEVRGEIVIVVAGASPQTPLNEEEATSLVLSRVEKGQRLKDAAKAVAVQSGLSAKVLYNRALAERK